MAEEAPNISQLLHELAQGRGDAVDRLLPLVYDELRRMAHDQLQEDRSGQTLNTTGLVHETYVRLAQLNRVEWRNRTHFLAVAARVMRRVLIDYARAGSRDMRTAGATQGPPEHGGAARTVEVEELVALDEALNRLEALNERQCRVVECRCFAGMSVEETATALGTSPAAVERDWTVSRAWLNRELGRRPNRLTTPPPPRP